MTKFKLRDAFGCMAFASGMGFGIYGQSVVRMINDGAFVYDMAGVGVLAAGFLVMGVLSIIGTDLASKLEVAAKA